MGRQHARPDDEEERARRRDAPHQRPHRRAGLPHRGRPPRPRLQRPVLRHEQQPRAPGRQGVRQPRPVQPHLFHGRRPGAAPHRPPRQGGDERRGHREELRLRHRRRLRPVPLRHVRDRVPQGPPRRRLRGLPGHALPAAGRPLPGHRRGRRPGDEPGLLHRRHQGRRLRRRAQRPRLPHPPLRGRARRHQPRPRGGEEDLSTRPSTATPTSSSRSTRRAGCWRR